MPSRLKKKGLDNRSLSRSRRLIKVRVVTIKKQLQDNAMESGTTDDDDDDLDIIEKKPKKKSSKDESSRSE